MRSRLASVVLVLASAGCAIEHGNPPPERQASAARSPHPARGDSAQGAEHAVFDRRTEEVAPGVTRLTIRVVLRSAAGEAAARARLQGLADAARQGDSALAAVRVLAYLLPTAGHGDAGSMGLVPFAYLEWIPAGGWDRLTAQSARAAHHTDVMFVQDLPAHPAPQERGKGGR